jgi:hypothetical protein
VRAFVTETGQSQIKPAFVPESLARTTALVYRHQLVLATSVTVGPTSLDNSVVSSGNGLHSVNRSDDDVISATNKSLVDCLAECMQYFLIFKCYDL